MKRFFSLFGAALVLAAPTVLADHSRFWDYSRFSIQFSPFLGGIRVAEGVGFEPTVSYPTFDFESSALNRAQPPFQFIISELCTVQNLKIPCAALQRFCLCGNLTSVATGVPQHSGWVPTKVQFLYQHRSGRHYGRTWAGSKQK